jgi:iron complex outermembrane receptor protein
LTETTVDKVNVPESLARNFSFENQGQVANTLFNREEQNRLEDALPRQNGVFTARYELNRVAFTGRANYFGKVEYKPTGSITLSDGTVFFTNDETFGAKTTFDLDISYKLTRQLRLSIGANNIFNTFPDRHGTPEERAAENPNLSSNYSNGRFVYSRRVTQIGMNGGFYYTRFSWTL